MRAEADVISNDDARVKRELFESQYDSGDISAQIYNRRIQELTERETDTFLARPTRRTGVGLRVAAMATGALAIAAVISLIYEPQASPATPASQSLAAAITQAKRAATSHPDSISTWVVLAQLQFMVGNASAASISYRKALHLNPRGDSIRVELAYVLLKERHSRSALEVLGEMRTERDQAKAIFLKGLAFGQLGRKREAANEFRMFLRAAPRSPLAKTAEKMIPAMVEH